MPPFHLSFYPEIWGEGLKSPWVAKQGLKNNPPWLPLWASRTRPMGPSRGCGGFSRRGGEQRTRRASRLGQESGVSSCTGTQVAPEGESYRVSSCWPEYHAGVDLQVPTALFCRSSCRKKGSFLGFWCGTAHQGSGYPRDGCPLGGCHSSSLGFLLVCCLLWPLSLIVNNGYTSRDSPPKCFNLPDDPVRSLPRFTAESWVSGSK